MTEFVVSAALILAGASWIKTGRSPFLLMAVACTHAEAARRQLYSSVKTGVLHFLAEYRATAQAVRAEVAE